MIDASRVEVPGDGSAAGLAKRESKRAEKESSRKGQTSSSNTATTASGPGDQRKNEEKRGRKPTENKKSKEQGRSRSKINSLSAAPADETKRADEASALPSSPSTARSTTIKAEDCGEKKRERRRRSDGSCSSIPSRTLTSRKPSKDCESDQDHSSQAPSSDVLVEAKAQLTTATTARAPSSVKGAKRRKRSRSSKTMSVNNHHDCDNEREETPRIQQITVPSGGDNAGRAATPSSSGTTSSDVRSNAGANSYVCPIAAEERGGRECVLEDKQPVRPMSDHEADFNQPPTEGSTTQTKNGVLKMELRCSEAEVEESAPDVGVRLERQESSARGRGEKDGEENLPGMGKRNGTEDGLSRRHRSSTTEERSRRKRVATNPSPSTALGVKVIDDGDTKHFVLTAGDTTAGDGKSGSGSDRLRGSISSSRNRNFAMAVPTRGKYTVNPVPSPERRSNLTDALEQPVLRDVTSRVASQQAPPAEGFEAEEKQQSEPTNDHYAGHPLMFARKDEAPACKASACPASPSNSSPCMAPSFSITTNDTNTDQARGHGSPPPRNKRPSLHRATPLPDKINIQSSPTASTSSSSSLHGRPVSDRTAKYVAHQASFHADISDDYVDLNSPLGTVRGEERAGGGEEPEMGMATSSPPVDKSIQENNDPVVPSSRQPPVTVWETSSQTFTCGTAPKGYPNSATVSKTELIESPPSWAPSTGTHVGSLAGEGGNARSDSNQQGDCDRSATPSLSQDARVGRSEEDDDEPARDLLHFRTDAPRHLVYGGRPELFFLRANESLTVTRIEGYGRLLVTVREEAGAAAVVVIDRAIVHDSAAHFGHAAVQVGCVLFGMHRPCFQRFGAYFHVCASSFGSHTCQRRWSCERLHHQGETGSHSKPTTLEQIIIIP